MPVVLDRMGGPGHDQAMTSETTEPTGDAVHPEDIGPHADEPHHEGVASRLNWLRAGVLGANDGIVSTAGIVVGVAGATTDRSAIVVAGVAGLVAVELVELILRLAWPDATVGSDAISGLGPDPFSLPVILLVGVYVPFLEELAFRAWLIPVAERAIGLWPACALSVFAFAAIHLPFAGPELLGTLVLGAIFAVVYALTRSLPACLVAHGGYNVLALGLHVAVSG